MSGPQYIHVEGYARKATNGKTTTSSGVIGEAIRQDGYCDHVGNPTPPKFYHGTKEGLMLLDEEIQKAADAAKDAQGRKMRSDQTTLLAGVASYPKPTKGLTAEDKEEMEKWIKETNSFLYKEFRGNFKAALLHLDEEYPHLHFYVADIKDPMKTKDLHPARATGAGKSKKDGITALKGFQDRYNEQVGQKFGMTRVGPKRERLSRPDWLEKKRQAEELAKKIKEVTVLEARAEKSIAEAETQKSLAIVERAHLKEERQQLQKQLTVLTTAAEKYNTAAEKLVERGLKVQKPFELQNADKILEQMNKPKSKPNLGNLSQEKQKPTQPKPH